MAKRVSRRRLLRDGGRGLLGLALYSRCRVAQPPFDFVLRGGRILDGTGGPPLDGDVAIAGDTIAEVGRLPARAARRVLEVGGLHVAPGFIDIHSHSDRTILTCPTADSRVLQGITTEVTGNCGSSAAPLAGKGEEERRKALREAGVEAAWTDVASYAARVAAIGISVNHALLLGQGTLRANAVGNVDRPLTPEELRGLIRAVEEGMDQGAFGLSTGLEYTPGRYTPAEEIVELAKVVARARGFYASHIRNEERELLEAVSEAIDVGRRSGLRVEVSHLKAAGRRHWHKQEAALALLESASQEGIAVLADVYPYAAYSTSLSIFLENWALEGSTKEVMGRLRDPAARSRIRAGLDPRVERDPGGYELIVVSSVKTEPNRSLVGRNLLEIAGLWKSEPADALLRLLEEEESSVSFVGHGMSPENVERVLAHPLVLIVSVGVSMAPGGRAAATRPHPRSYGTCARVLGTFVRERRVLDLPCAVRKMTLMPADQVGLRDRGRIELGRKADLVVFDAATVRDEASFEEPQRHPRGIVHVLVNGVPVVEGGKHTGALPGRLLRRDV